MESYIEISFISQMLTMLISCMTAGYLSLKPISMKQSLVYSSCIASFSCLLWNEHSWSLILMIEALFFLKYFRYRWKTYLLIIILRILLSMTWFAFYRGGFHNFQYFLPMISPIPINSIQLILLWLLYRKWNYWIGKLDYVYECYVDKMTSKIPLKGYLDTGNTMMFEDTPIVFVDERYQEYFESDDIQCIVMNTMTGSEVIMCYHSTIHIQGLMKKNVYVHCKKNMQLPMQCQILLNINLWLG